jgi:hypothetical protein
MVTPERLREVTRQLDEFVERGWLVKWRWYDQDLVRRNAAWAEGAAYAADHSACAING